MRTPHLHRVGGWFAALTALALAVVTPSGQSRSDDPAAWLARPSTMPTDVFDLPAFDRYRSGGQLNVVQAAAHLEALSDRDLPAAQRLFDVIAWRAFVALNWAARPDGSPDQSKGFGDLDAPTS